jgi:polygalacturonase
MRPPLAFRTRPTVLALALLFALAARAAAALTQPVVPIPPAPPRIPESRISLADFDAVPDGVTLNTKAFERALAALSDRGGGTLVVPSGIWLTGPIRLRSRINLHLEAGAVIQFSRDHALYPMRIFDARGEKQVDTTSPLSGDKLEEVAITGAGIIDGGGDAWRLVKKGKVTENFWRNLVASGGVLNARGDEWWPSQAALDGALAVRALEQSGSLNPTDYEPYRVFLRPRLLRLLECRRVLLEGVTFRNAPNWTLHPWLCEDVIVRDVKIFNDRWAQNSDALDVESCRRVHVTGCIVDTGDDGLCLKSGINESGRRIGVPTEDVLIENCTVYDGHGGFTIGSEMSGGVRNVLVQNCTFLGTDLGLRFKTARGRGGVVENIHIRGIRMTGIVGSAIDFNFFYFSEGQATAPVPPVTVETPVFRNILFEDIVSRGSKSAFTLRGLPEMPLRDITFRDVALSAGTGADLANADRIVFERVSIRAQQGVPLKAVEVTNARLEIIP